MFRPGVMTSTYYPATGSTVPPEQIQDYRHRDYASDFDTTPMGSTETEDADGYVTWTGGACSASWTPALDQEAPDV